MMSKRNMQQEMEGLRALEGKAAEAAPPVERPAVAGPGMTGAEDWGLYDDEERQLEEALRLSEQEAAAAGNADGEMAAAQRRQEEAELKHAIAMSLQIQE